MSLRCVAQVLVDRAGNSARNFRDYLTLDSKRPKVFNTNTSVDNLRRGALVGFGQYMVDFILFEGTGSFVSQPNGHYLTVLAGGRIEDGNFVIHRLYLQEEDEESPRILQIVTDLSGKVIHELRLFEQLCEPIDPQTSEEWDDWLTGRTIEGQFFLPRIGGISFDYEQKTFYRAWGVNAQGVGDEVIAPLKYTEKIYVDDYGEPKIVTSQVMAYARPVGDATEHLFLSAMCSRTNGVEDRWIEAWVGIELDPTKLTVIAGK